MRKTAMNFKKRVHTFRSSAVSGQITNKNAREYKTTIYVLKGAKININKKN